MQTHATRIDAAQTAQERHAIQLIADNWQSNGRQMHTNLMCAPGVRFATENRHMAIPKTDVCLADKFGVCRFTMLAADAEFLDFPIGHFADGRTYLERFSRIWIDRRTIGRSIFFRMFSGFAPSSAADCHMDEGICSIAGCRVRMTNGNTTIL